MKIGSASEDLFFWPEPGLGMRLSSSVVSNCFESEKNKIENKSKTKKLREINLHNLSQTQNESKI